MYKEARPGPAQCKIAESAWAAGTFPGTFWQNSGKTPERLSESFLEFPSRVRLGCPKPYDSRHLRLPERFQNSLPPQYGWGRLFFQKWFRRGPLRAVVMEFPAALGGFLTFTPLVKGVWAFGQFLTVFGRRLSHFYAPFACCHLAAAITQRTRPY